MIAVDIFIDTNILIYAQTSMLARSTIRPGNWCVVFGTEERFQL